LSGQVRLSIHDARGARIRRLVDGVLAGGGHQSTWDGRDEAGRPVPSGSYFARLEVGSTVETGKLVLVR
jgi:flagellar hook assembly protein FlgD